MNKKRSTKHSRLVLACLMLSILSWFAVKMSKNYTQTYSFAVEFVNLPNGKVVTYQSDTMILVEVNSKGIFLISLELKKKRIAIDYHLVTTSSQRKSAHISISARQLKDYLIENRNFPQSTTLIEPKKIGLDVK